LRVLPGLDGQSPQHSPIFPPVECLDPPGVPITVLTRRVSSDHGVSDGGVADEQRGTVSGFGDAIL